MDQRGGPAPRRLGSIRNFAWLQPGILARGEQPQLYQDTFTMLRGEGVATVLSLREAHDWERRVAGRTYPEYLVDAERALCAAAGLGFRHVPCQDFEAPSPREVAEALGVIDDEAGAGRAVYAHCLAGVGRTGLVTSAWLLAHGWSADDVVATFFRFFDEFRARSGIPVAEQAGYLARMGAPKYWWALRVIAEAVGNPVPDAGAPVQPRQPERTEGWAAEYRRRLAPWRARPG